jgi:hypothetical protein
VIELDKNENFYKYKNNDIGMLLLYDGDKYYVVNWDGKFKNIMNVSMDDWDIDIIKKVRGCGVNTFTTQF